MHKLAIIILFFVFNFPILAQRTDSLKKVLKTNQSDTSKISTLFELASELYLVNPDTTIKICEEILFIAKKIDDKKNIAESYGWLGYLYAHIGEIDKALKYDTLAAKYLQKTENKKSLAITYINIASIYNDKGEILKALKYYKKSTKIQTEIDDKNGLAITLNNIGYIYYHIGDIEKAIDYWMKSKKILFEVDDKKGVATIYTNLGAVYSLQGNKSKAKEYYLKSLSIYKKIKDTEGEAIAFKNIGSIYFENDQYSLARNYFIKSIILHKKLKNISGVAELYLDLANIEEINTNYDLAKVYAEKSLKIYQKLEDKFGIASANLKISDYYFYKKSYQQAIKYALFANQEFLELGYPESIQNSAKRLKEIYEKLKNYKESYYYFNIEMNMKDSIYNEKNYKKLIQQQTRYEFNKQAAIDSLTIIRIKSENVIKERELLFTIISLIIISISLIVIFIFYYQKIKINKILKEQNNEIKNKKEELNQQNEEIKTFNDRLSEKQKKLSDAHKEITDSVKYAKKIQIAAFPPNKFFEQNFSEYFILFNPLKVVSGDFYWAKKFKEYIIFAVADSSGHGVPGAFISMLGISILNEILFLEKINSANEILDNVRERIKVALNQINSSENDDGLDISLCLLNTTNLELQFSGAYNSLYIISSKNDKPELKILKADRQPVGVFVKEHPFSNKKIKLSKGDKLYLFTDGFMDQFDYKVKQKFGRSRFRNLIIENYNKSMPEQKELIIDTFYDWKGGTKQIDDILVLGIKI